MVELMYSRNYHCTSLVPVKNDRIFINSSAFQSVCTPFGIAVYKEVLKSSHSTKGLWQEKKKFSFGYMLFLVYICI